MWLQDAVVIKGPRCLGERPEATSHPDELLTWLAATGWTDGKDQGWGDLTLLPSDEGAQTNKVDESGHILYGFHRTCTSLAYQFIQLSPITTLETFCDIWVIINARYSKDPFQNNLFNLPQELLEEITEYLRYGSTDLQPTYLLSRSFWKQLFIKLPFLWDLDVQQVQQFPYSPIEAGKEWDWEHLVRQIMARPVKFQRPIYSGCHDFSLKLWDYGQVGLDMPLGMTNRRRMWQILEDMDL
ncbi:unnamed protein product [Fusarium venenatum]|uniref:F-box domain-containing protein n=1 Tax=Fusarium venenatum TaxID=56646 RepID=A0A2L2T6U2_9HYPO|nr:uncharacterized protein FVRRES_12389 [Fusarium venenatum]CEI39698.1 unnamed protein product [Fusarium venenatum]